MTIEKNITSTTSFQGGLIELARTDIVSSGSLLWMYQTVSNALLAPQLEGQEFLAIMASIYGGRYRENCAFPHSAIHKKLIDIFQQFHMEIMPKTWTDVIVKQYIGDIVSQQFISRENDGVHTYEEQAGKFFLHQLHMAVEKNSRLIPVIHLYLRRIESEFIASVQFALAAVYDNYHDIVHIALANEVADIVSRIMDDFAVRKQHIIEVVEKSTQ